MVKKLRKTILLAFLVLIATGCEKAEDPCCIIDEKVRDSIEGSWLLYETGYSPGAGYIVEPVPPIPRYVVTFAPGGELVTSIDAIKKFKYYRVLDDPNYPDRKILALYIDDPGDEPQDISQLQHSYSITRTENNLKLSFRYCIEGCHMAFWPITLKE